ncbi:hypothetical protein [Paenibacillus campi]|uniref:hypothetical protein n=1 Tax=Paenibacillus campi TaxID=3106031 RepID=UPI002AFE4BD2|nr:MULTISPECIES: hypothetical protein [unclassified Paenibacillus]
MSAFAFGLIMFLFCMPFQSADETDYDYAVTNGIAPGALSLGHARFVHDGNDTPEPSGGIALSVMFSLVLLSALDRTHLLSCIPLLLKRLLLAALKYRSNYMDTLQIVHTSSAQSVANDYRLMAA